VIVDNQVQGHLQIDTSSCSSELHRCYALQAVACRCIEDADHGNRLGQVYEDLD